MSQFTKKSIFNFQFKKNAYLCTSNANNVTRTTTYVSTGKMAERSNAAVLKTVDLRGSGGSNPSLSAKETLQVINNQSFAAFFFTLVSQLVSHF